MDVLKIVAAGLNISSVGFKEIPAGNRKSVLLDIEYDDTWDGYGKTAVFFSQSNMSAVYEVLVENNHAFIPAEVMCYNGSFFIGLRGNNDDAVKTTNLLKIRVVNGSPAGSTTVVEPTSEIYQQIIASYGSLETKITAFEDYLKQVDRSQEIIDARRGTDGKTYDSLGQAIRGNDYLIRQELEKAVKEINSEIEKLKGSDDPSGGSSGEESGGGSGSSSGSGSDNDDEYDLEKRVLALEEQVGDIAQILKKLNDGNESEDEDKEDS